MKKAQFLEIEEYMHECMGDSAHTSQHIYRVLFLALQIAQEEKNVNYDVLIASCLLHDISRDKQFSDSSVCHAEAGAKMAGEFLDGKLEDQEVMHICECIRTHRFRGDSVPKSIEAKILFDADTLHVTGAIGVARTLLYQGKVNTPIYSTDENKDVIIDNNPKKSQSFVDEYNYKLKRIYSKLYTLYAKEIAEKRKEISEVFYNSLLDEVNEAIKGKSVLSDLIDNI